MDIYKKIDLIYQRRDAAEPPAAPKDAKDSAAMTAWHQANWQFIQDSILPHTRKIINSTFPDVFFEDLNGKSLAISDFRDMEVIVNYNYLYCQPCLDRIDSTERIISGRNIKLLVLFLDTYKAHISDLKPYGENIQIGFVNPDNADLITLKQGDNFMCYLNKDRQVEFFDKAYPSDKDHDWTNFLREHLK